MMWLYASIPFCLQALLIGIDEGYYHIKRGLPVWERIGHPIDTLFFLLCLLFTLFMPYSDTNLKIYIGLTILSCLMVTKDEFVHKHYCPAAENWLHALLFILHPITLITAGLMWPVIQGATVPTWLLYWLDNSEALHTFMTGQTLLIFIFFAYQVIFWNFIWKEKKVLKM
jgi:hypothetical protein